MMRVVGPVTFARRHLAVLVIVAVLAGGGLTGFALYESFAVARQRSEDNEARTAEICRSGNDTRAAVRDVFEIFEAEVAKTPNRTPEEIERADRFFEQVYARLRSVNCQPNS